MSIRGGCKQDRSARRGVNLDQFNQNPVIIRSIKLINPRRDSFDIIVEGYNIDGA